MIKGSIGNGVYVEIPWIGIFNKKITCSAQKGIYIVLLFNADYSKVYLSLNQGMTYFEKRFKSHHPKDKLRLASNLLQTYVPETNLFSTEPIDLNARTNRGTTYPNGHIIGKSYIITELPSDNHFIQDILALIKIYDKLSDEIGNRSVDEFYDCLFLECNGYILEESESQRSAKRLSSQEHIISTDDILDSASLNYNDDFPSKKKAPIKGKSGKALVPRSKIASERALMLANYRCENNQNHTSFLSKRTNTNYVEAHHLIPLSHYYDDEYNHSIDVSSNIVSLCPTCHKCIHLGNDEEKLSILIKLLSDERKKRLSDAGILVDIEGLRSLYEIDIITPSDS